MLNWEFTETDRENAVKEGIEIGRAQERAEIYCKVKRTNLCRAAEAVKQKKYSIAEAAKFFDVEKKELKKLLADES